MLRPSANHNLALESTGLPQSTRAIRQSSIACSPKGNAIIKKETTSVKFFFWSYDVRIEGDLGTVSLFKG